MGIQDTFAVNVRKYRKAVKLTQEKLAELSGLHRTYIGAIEQRRVNVSLKNIGRIADALGVDPVMLFLDAKDEAILPPQRSSDTFLEEGSEAARMRRRIQSDVSFEDVRRERAGDLLPVRTQGAENAPDLQRIDYALVSWSDGRFVMKPLEVRYEDLTIQVLCHLVESGYKGAELADRYATTQAEILSFIAGAV